MGRSRFLGLALAMGGAAALGVAALISARRSPGETLGGGTSWALALQLLSGLGAASVGASFVWHGTHRLVGALLLAAGGAVFLQQLPLPGSTGAVLFTAALAGGSMPSPLVGVAALVAAGGARRFPDALVAGVAVVVGMFVLGVLPTALFDPRSSGCFACSRNLLLVHGSSEVHDELIRAGLPAAAVACGLLALLASVRALARRGLFRSSTAPVVIGGAGAAALGAALFAHETGAGLHEIDSTTRALWLLQCGILAAVAPGVVLLSIRGRLLRDRIAAMVAAASPSAEALRAALAVSLGDPQLEIVFPRAGGGVVDFAGRDVAAIRGDVAVAEVVRRGQVVAQLRHAGRLSQMPERVTQAALGAGLALEHASLHARLEAEVADLAASRARIVDVGDGERRRLERNLHDGAQQRLIALLMELQLMSGPDAAIERAKGELQRALGNLRAIAHGIYPVSLAEAGLVEAARELADESRVPMRFEVGSRPHLLPSVEAAFYRLVLDCVRLAERYGNGAALVVQIEAAPGSARLRIVAPGVDQRSAERALEYARDRLDALSGTLRTSAVETDLVVEATVSCGS